MGEVEVQDHSAAYYEIRYSGYGRKYHAALVQQLLKDASGKVLDVGCGTGFATQVRPDLEIIGIDLSTEMLARHPGVWQEMDVTAMTFPPASFDFVLCRSLLHHLPDPWRGLSEMKRVLKPGGKIAFLETNKSTLATFVRKLTQHGDRFSQYHHSFKDTELLADISRWFTITEVQYLGFIAYPLFGFRDIIDFSPLIPFKSVSYPFTMGVDRCLSQLPLLKRLSWAIGIQAHRA